MGLDFISGTHDDMIICNAFMDIGGSGISVARFDVDERRDCLSAESGDYRFFFLSYGRCRLLR
jgi:hypothetical protein